ncbi:MAG: hypothetical protein LBI53_05895 [Candidatus Peribacteria bacterium]|jgi:hypothetical protein|nr:hypothetical protein [Candidatus Peribacteria bacterium]
MAKNEQKMPQSKMIFLLLLLVFVGVVIWYMYLFTSTSITKKLITANQRAIVRQEQVIASFSDIPGFDKLQLVQEYENNNNQMPRHNYIEAIRNIFEELKDLNSEESRNIELSDFKISLEEISLRGYVTNLRILYFSPDPEERTSLIERFENLPFLHQISIKTYEKAGGGIGYEFVLIAKVFNDATK